MIIKRSNLPSNLSYFTSIILDEAKILPKSNPSIQTLLKNDININIISIKVVQSNAGISNSNQHLTGTNLLIEISFEEFYRYISNTRDSAIHMANYRDVLKNAFIVVPSIINGVSMEEIIDKNRYKVNTIIEKSTVDLEDLRSFNLWASILVYIDFV